MSSLQVIFGTGPAGSTLAEELISQGQRVRCINRSGKADLPAAVEVVAGDLLNQGQVNELCQGAKVVYHCANVHYAEQTKIMPQFQQTIMQASAAAGARLVVLDTLYVYGSSQGRPMTEATPFAPHTRKGRMRADLVETYLAAHRAGTLEVTLGRAADFFGPRVLNSSLGDRVFPMLLQHKPAQLLGNIDLPHSFSYIGDVARGLALLGQHPAALGQAWHLPVMPALTQRAMLQTIGTLLDYPVRSIALPKMAIQAFGLMDSFMREFVEMFYQYTEPQIVDAQAIERQLGLAATPLEQALQTTINWYRGQNQQKAAA
ncbi:MAG TPA: epimerase [Herpetosiphon sp.]|uniref:NAD-dependent epimerase/dehydratase n=1 Tax=Herpetosiphon aurantiacus (strain ATCC 23779 / DSM 785 / 114-95) TaxID=316274 RepID=A9B3A7_HERA2|nr:NAD-dependent epimerase/dehydratase family protein [Herpetosiphon sp.]ABX04070.1 NAD-dependent epimerase/dehydratase [Herpetosiphon aurantiacus DSM 785]HBW49993.1 epimerase [Herpetosiphon sp.]